MSRSNKSLLLFKNHLPQQPSRVPAQEKTNDKNKMFNIQYNPCGPGHPSNILKFVQVTECQIEKIAKFSKKVKGGFKPAQWKNILNRFLNYNGM